MADFEIHIKTSADLKAASDLKRSLEEQVKATKALGQDSSGLEARLKSVDGALNSNAAHSGRLTEVNKAAADAARKLSGESGGLGGKLRDLASHIPGVEALGGVFSKIASGPIGAITAALGLATAAIQKFAVAEVEVAKLDAALAQQQLLTEKYRASLQKLAGELSKTTGVSKNEWLAVLRTLTQFGSDPKSIGMDAEAVKNLAGIMGGDLHSAAMLISRALEGNFTLFARHGIIIDETGTKAEKLARLYAELAQRGGGQLEASTRTLSGQFGALGRAITSPLGGIGRMIAETGFLQAVTSRLTITFDFLGSIFRGTIPKAEGLENALKKTTHSTLEGAAAAAALEESQKRIKESLDATITALNKEFEALERNKEARDKLADADMANELIRLKAARQRNQITDVQAMEKEHEIRERYAKKHFDIANETDKSEIAKGDKQAKEIETQLKAQHTSIRSRQALFEKTREFEMLRNALRATEREIEERSKAKFENPSGIIVTSPVIGGIAAVPNQIDEFAVARRDNEEKLAKAKARIGDLRKRMLAVNIPLPTLATNEHGPLPIDASEQKAELERQKKLQETAEEDASARLKELRERKQKVEEALSLRAQLYQRARKGAWEEFGGNRDAIRIKEAEERAKRADAAAHGHQEDETIPPVLPTPLDESAAAPSGRAPAIRKPVAGHGPHYVRPEFLGPPIPPDLTAAANKIGAATKEVSSAFDPFVAIVVSGFEQISADVTAKAADLQRQINAVRETGNRNRNR